MKQTIAIIHFNTPELKEACILSIRKHGCDWPVVVFDNSAETLLTDGDTAPARPFKVKMQGVKVIDNTHGQVINFEKWLDSIPEKNAKIGISGNYRWGSARHIYTVQKLWELIPDGFIDIRELWNPEYSFCGYRQLHQIGNLCDVPRILPMLCYMNVPLLMKEGARYYDPQRCWGLLPDYGARGNWFDTGSCLLDDIMQKRPRLKGLHIDIRLFIVHYGGASDRVAEQVQRPLGNAQGGTCTRREAQADTQSKEVNPRATFVRL